MGNSVFWERIRLGLVGPVMANLPFPEAVTSVARSAANRLVELFSGTRSDADDGRDLSYGFLIPGCTLSLDASVGNGHTAEVSASVNDQTFGPRKNRLALDAGPNEPLMGQFLTIVADVSVGAGSPTPPPPPLVTITLFQQSPRAPGKRLVLETLNVKGTFDTETGTIAQLDIPILLK
jgi:hypothetical protein